MNNKQKLLEELYKQYKNCINCPLGLTGRKNIVFGSGNPNSKLLIIGEAPGQQEDLQSKPFVGKAGKYLRLKLKEANINDFYVTNIVKCRPPNNRKPFRTESAICKNIILYNQIKIIKPKIICTLGVTALEETTNKKWNFCTTRGSTLKIKNITIIPTYHPSYVARHIAKAEKEFIKDIKSLSDFLLVDNKPGG